MKKIFLVLFSVLAVGAAGFVIWCIAAPQYGEHAQAALQSDQFVTITEDDGFTYTPIDPNGVGLIFYPGARVRPGSYAMEMHNIASQGYLVVVPKMPLNMAWSDIDRADDIMADYPEIETWVIGGHSLGGAMAGSYANKNAEKLDGLMFWASYPPKSDDLSQSELPVISISGEFDGLSTPAKIDASKPILPADAQFVQIKGANHAQFGDYGKQAGDDDATIPPEQQWDEITQITLDWFEELALP